MFVLLEGSSEYGPAFSFMALVNHSLNPLFYSDQYSHKTVNLFSSWIPTHLTLDWLIPLLSGSCSRGMKREKEKWLLHPGEYFLVYLSWDKSITKKISTARSPKLSSDAFGSELSSGHVITSLCIESSWNDGLHFRLMSPFSVVLLKKEKCFMSISWPESKM